MSSHRRRPRHVAAAATTFALAALLLLVAPPPPAAFVDASSSSSSSSSSSPSLLGPGRPGHHATTTTTGRIPRKTRGGGDDGGRKTRTPSPSSPLSPIRGGGDDDDDDHPASSATTANGSADSDGGSSLGMTKGRDGVNVDVATTRGGIEELIAAARERYAPSSSSSSSSSTTTTTAGGTRGGSTSSSHISTRFPVSISELPHFGSMSIMMFLFIYVFTTVRDTKDTLVVSNCGAEAIPFLKLYGVMPCATAFILAYSKLSDVLDKKLLFYVTLVPFFVFYGLFAFVLFPNRDGIHFPSPPVMMDGGGDVLLGVVGGGGATGAAMNLLRYWSFSLYFIVSELWASAGVPLLFWQCANDVTPMSQAKRFYPLFAITGNLAPIVSGKIMSHVISLQKSNDDVGFGSTLKTLAIVKGMACLGIVAIHRRVYAMAEERERRERTEESLSTIRGIRESGKVEITMEFKKPKRKLTLRQSASELMASRELKAMATMVFCYNACVELTEVLWKAILRRTYPNKSQYMDYMARFSQTVGVVAFLLQLVASEIINVLGWRWTAMIPPLTMGILAAGFFAAVIAGEERIPLAEALLIGTVQNVVNKVTKYSLFDPCKEMAYIPLGPEAKVKGKAAVDVLGARLGRSMGSATQQLMVFLVGGPSGSIINCAPYLGGCYMAAVAMWSNAVSVLARLFDNADSAPKVNTHRLEQIGEAITIIKSIEDAKREKKKKSEDEQEKNPKKIGK